MSDQADREILVAYLKWHGATTMPPRLGRKFAAFLDRLAGPDQFDLFERKSSPPRPTRSRRRRALDRAAR